MRRSAVSKAVAVVAVAASIVAASSRVAISAGPAHGDRRHSVAGLEGLPVGTKSLLNAYATLPVTFAENRGQLDGPVRYYAHGSRYGFYFTRDGLMLSFAKRSDPAVLEGVAIALRFIRSSPTFELVGEGRAAGTLNYLRGTDPARWQTGIPTFGQVVYRGLWPGVDMVVQEQAGSLKYEFRVQPGARPADIGLEYVGSNGLMVDGTGALLIATAMGVLRDSAPTAYQVIDGVRAPVDSRFVLEQDGSRSRFGFDVGRYRSDRELIVDPGVEYSTFLGGTSHELGAGIAVDAAGHAYVVGTTQSPNFPTTAGAFRRTGAASTVSDVFVAKFNPAGSALVYSTFIGGSNFDFGRRIAIDTAGNAYVTGQTKSSNFPTTGGAFDRTFNILNCPRCGIDQYDAFVTKLNASGSALVYSTFLGGTDIDDARGIAVDGAGNAYVTGETLSRDFPTRAGSVDTSHNGAYDVFVTKVNATGSALVYSAFLGGSQVDNGERVAVDSGGNAYVTGFTSSADFPTTAGAFDTTANGAFDVFVARLNPAGSALSYSTFLGGQGFDSAGGLAIDAAGAAYVSGATGSVDFPTTAGAFDPQSDGSDAFVARLHPSGSALIYSTVLGGADGDGATAVALDASGNAWVTGSTSSADFPLSPNAFDSTFNGIADAFAAQLNATGSALLYATFLGGAQSESGNDIAVDVAGDAYLTGHSYSLDFPVTAGAFDTIFNGDPSIFWGDAFVTKIAAATDDSTPPAPPGTPPAPVLVSPPNGDNPPQPITFDWNDAPSAVSYTIQIDDSSDFAAPLIRNQSGVTTSMFVAGDLATATHFWRVRGVNSAGTAGAWSAVRSFTPQAAPPPATLSTMSTNPSVVAGGNPSSATIVLSVPAPTGGALITLSSSHPAIASVPASATVPAFGFTATFAIATSAVASNTTVTITAAYNGTTRSATLTVTPPAPPPPSVSLESVTVSPTSVTAGSTAQGSVRLSSAAPSTGVSVGLSSSHPGIVTVPPAVVLFPGVTTTTFTATTSSVSASTTVTISAAYDGTTRTASVTVTPAASPSTATLTVTATGRSGERVVSNPSGINVPTGSQGSASFASGTSITLSVSNGRDAIWSGACSSGGDKRRTCTFTLTGTAAVAANVQ